MRSIRHLVILELNFNGNWYGRLNRFFFFFSTDCHTMNSRQWRSCKTETTDLSISEGHEESHYKRRQHGSKHGAVDSPGSLQYPVHVAGQKCQTNCQYPIRQGYQGKMWALRNYKPQSTFFSNDCGTKNCGHKSQVFINPALNIYNSYSHYSVYACYFWRNINTQSQVDNTSWHNITPTTGPSVWPEHFC